MLMCLCCEADDFPGFSCLEDLALGLCPQQPSLHISLKAQGGLTREESRRSGAAAPPDQAPIATGPAPGQGPSRVPREQLETARGAGSGLLDPVARCPAGLQGRVAQGIHGLT